MKCNVSQIKAFHATCSRLGMDVEAKRELVSNATKGQHTSSKDLSYHEMEAILTNLNGPRPQAEGAVAARAQMIRKIYFYAHEMGWHLTDESGKLLLFQGKPRVDVQRLNAWATKYGQHHKAIDKHSAKEIQDVLTAFENVHKSHLKGVK